MSIGFMKSATRAVAALGLAGSLALSPVAAEEASQPTTTSHGISAFGELKYPADFEAFDYVNVDAPREGGIILLPRISGNTFDTFNLAIPAGDAPDGALLLFDTLMVRAFDEPDAVYGLVAQSVEMPADRSFAIFRLRPEAKFADGSPLTAEDVAWTIETLKREGAPQYQVVLSNVEKSTVVDPHTVRFDFADGAGARDLPAFVAQAPIFAKSWFADREFGAPTLEPPLTSGPYKVGKFEAGSYVEYVRREDYWAKDLPVMRGQYNFDSVKFEYYSSRDLALEFFKSGSFGFNQEYISKNWATAYDFEAITSGRVIKEVMPDGRPSGAQGWWLNLRRAKFADPRVREAIGLVFDFELTNKQIFYGLYERTRSPFENSDFVAQGEPSPEELALLEPYRAELPEAVFGPAVTPPVTEGRRGLRRSVAKARALLEEAGWKVDPSDGLLKDASGAVMEIEFLDQAGSSFDRIVKPFIQNLELLGIKAVYRGVDAAQYLARRRSFDYDVITGRFAFQATLGPGVRSIFHSDGAASEGSFNLSGVASPALDAMILAMENATSRAELVAAGRAFDRVFRAGHYWVPHWYSSSYRIAYWDRFGRPRDLGIQEAKFERGVLLTWWLDAEKAAKLKPVIGR